MTPDEAFERHRPLAGRIAGKYLKRLPSFVDKQEVEAVAMGGLWDAALRHHDLPPNEFQAVASARIMGSIADEFRTMDHFPRHTRRGYGALFHMIYLDAIEDIDNVQTFATFPDVENAIDRAWERHWVWRRSARLPPQQRKVVRMLLVGERQKDISVSLGLTEARVSQIAAEAVSALRRKLQTRPRLR